MADGRDIPAIERASDNEFRSALNTHQDAIDSSEKQAEHIEQLTNILMAPGNDYDPYNLKNFEQALSDAPESAIKFVWAFYVEAAKDKFRDNTTNHTAIYALDLMVWEYWEKLATARAEYLIREAK